MFGTFHSIWTFDVENVEVWLSEAAQALEVLQAKSGFIEADVFRSADEPYRFLVKTDWENVGSYRKALGSTEAKIEVWPFLTNMHDGVSAFEKLLNVGSASSDRYESSVNGEHKS